MDVLIKAPLISASTETPALKVIRQHGSLFGDGQGIEGNIPSARAHEEDQRETHPCTQSRSAHIYMSTTSQWSACFILGSQCQQCISEH